MDDKMKKFLYKIKSEKKKKNKNFDKTENLEIELVKVKYAINPNKLQSEIKELNKIQVVNKNLHEIKQKNLIDHAGDFEMNGTWQLGNQFRHTHIRFINNTDYEAYVNAIDQDYGSDHAIFNGFIYKIKTPQLNLVNRSQYGNGCDFKREIIEYRCNDCFVPTKSYCFFKCQMY